MGSLHCIELSRENSCLVKTWTRCTKEFCCWARSLPFCFLLLVAWSLCILPCSRWGGSFGALSSAQQWDSFFEGRVLHQSSYSRWKASVCGEQNCLKLLVMQDLVSVRAICFPNTFEKSKSYWQHLAHWSQFGNQLSPMDTMKSSNSIVVPWVKLTLKRLAIGGYHRRELSIFGTMSPFFFSMVFVGFGHFLGAVVAVAKIRMDQWNKACLPHLPCFSLLVRTSVVTDLLWNSSAAQHFTSLISVSFQSSSSVYKRSGNETLAQFWAISKLTAKQAMRSVRRITPET